MGSLYRLECPGCRYSAEVSAGADAGFAGEVETMVCRHEVELFDVLTVAVMEEAEDRVGVCPSCGRSKLESWDPEQCLCPKCNSTMSKMEVGMWD